MLHYLLNPIFKGFISYLIKIIRVIILSLLTCYVFSPAVFNTQVILWQELRALLE